MIDLSEIKETVYIAVSSTILAAVLTLVSVFTYIRSDLAAARNEEILSAQNILQYRQFNKYDNKTVYGDEVIELIRLYYDAGIEIYVNSPDGVSGPIRINETTVKSNPTLISLTYLQNTFQTRRQYTAQVVYNAINPATVTAPMTNKPQGSEVTGISLIWVSNN